MLSTVLCCNVTNLASLADATWQAESHNKSKSIFSNKKVVVWDKGQFNATEKYMQSSGPNTFVVDKPSGGKTAILHLWKKEDLKSLSPKQLAVIYTRMDLSEEQYDQVFEAMQETLEWRKMEERWGDLRSGESLIFDTNSGHFKVTSHSATKDQIVISTGSNWD